MAISSVTTWSVRQLEAPNGEDPASIDFASPARFRYECHTWGGSASQEPNVISVAADVARNRIILTLKGQPLPVHLAEASKHLPDLLTRVKAPFDLLSDVRELDSLELLASPQVCEVVSTILRHGVRRTVRIVGRSATGALHMERIARQIDHHAHLAFSFEEAEQLFSSR